MGRDGMNKTGVWKKYAPVRNFAGAETFPFAAGRTLAATWGLGFRMPTNRRR